MRSHYRNKKIERQQKWQKARPYILVIGLVAIFVGLVHGLLFGKAFQIKNFVVESELPINETDIIAQAKAQVVSGGLGGILGSNNYLAWPKKIQNNTPEVSTLEIKKQWKDRSIIISPVLRRNHLTWCQASGPDQSTCYWVDREGIVFDEAPIAEGNFITTIYDNSLAPEPVIIGGHIVDEISFTYIENIIDAHKSLGLDIEKITLDKALEELHVKLLSGGTILFNLRFDPTINALPALAKIQSERNLNRLNYLDLTVDGRAFYKEK